MSDTDYEVDFVLIAHGTDHAQLIPPAFANAARAGFGPDRIPHRMLDVYQVMANGDRGVGAFLPERLGDYPLPVPPRTRKWRIDFVTPLHLKERGSPLQRPNLELILRATERRLRLLAQVSETDVPIRVEDTLFDHARNTTPVDSHFQWSQWKRFSARQHVKVPVEGALGTIRFQHPVGPFGSLLRAASIVHVGGKTSLGLGRIAVRHDTKPTVVTRGTYE